MTRINFDRRRFLKAGAGACGVALAPSVLLADTTPSEDGFTILRAMNGSASLLGPGEPQTAIWAYEGMSPGPTLRVRRGDTVRVRLVNELDQPTTIHWHGIRIDNAMDGVVGLTQAAVPPGGSFDYVFTVPDAGTFWYHTHNRSWEQMARGLYGLLVVDEIEPYGVDREIPIVFDDWRLTAGGEIEEESLGSLHDWAHRGRLGNWLTVNGVSAPALQIAQGERLRLRLANVANARVLAFDFPGHEPWLIAVDGHAVKPEKLAGSRIELAPAQRADLVMDAVLEPGTTAEIREVGNGEPYKAASLIYSDKGNPIRNRDKTPAGLPVVFRREALDIANAVTVDLDMTGGAMGAMESAVLDGETLGMRELVAKRRVWAFNGIAGDLDKPLLEVGRGGTVAIRMTNNTRWSHAMHLHGHHFLATHRNGEEIAETVWHDTILMQPDETLTIAFLADNPGKWLLHCHMVEHMAGGMITWINVTA